MPEEELLERFGSPLFVIDADRLEQNLHDFTACFRQYYPRVQVAYSYKTNPLLAVRQVVHAGGAWAEVASGLEYEMARAAGVPGEQIVFNGPCKRDTDLCLALAEGAIVNVDNEDELERVAVLVARHRLPRRIGLRVHTDLGVLGFPDRFGFSMDSGAAEEAAVRALAMGLEVAGLHVHLCSYIILPSLTGIEGTGLPLAAAVRILWPHPPERFGAVARQLVDLAARVERRTGMPIHYLDMGGGYPAPTGLAPYAAAIAAAIAEGTWSPATTPLLLLEPGRALVHDAGRLLCRVLFTRPMPGGRWAIAVDAGTQVLPTVQWCRPTVRPLTPRSGPRAPTVIYGPSCLQTDLLAVDEPLPPLVPGDVLVIEGVGAYNLAQASSFILPRPAVVMVSGARVHLIRRRETIEDLLASEGTWVSDKRLVNHEP